MIRCGNPSFLCGGPKPDVFFPSCSGQTTESCELKWHSGWCCCTSLLWVWKWAQKSATFEFHTAAKKEFHTNELIRPGRSERLLLWRLLRAIFSLIVSVALRLSKCCKSENLLFLNYKYPLHIDQCWYICSDSRELEPIPAEIGSLHQM